GGRGGGGGEASPGGGRRRRPLPPLGRRRAHGSIRLRRRDLTQAYLVRLMEASPDPRRVLALGLALEIVGADPDARLFQEIRERLGLGYDLGASVELGADWAVAIVSASSSRDDERRLTDTVERTCQDAAGGFSADELARARQKIRYRFARLATSPLDRAVSHATRAANGQLSLAHAARLVPRITLAEVDAAWRSAL